MAGDAIHQQVNRLFGPGTVGALTDGQLLERFATRRGEAAEAAFEGLVARHGPMVLRVCRALLRDPHDADDAFQATFLVLARRAGSIGERDVLGPWLYGVARRVALKARGVAARRRAREGGNLLDDPPVDPAEGPWIDLRPVLHEELDRLPDKYRKPVVLCHLQGLTHAEAAQELAWPVGTVSVRLSRAKKLLRDRLTRRGLTATATLWAAGLAAEGATAAVPAALLRSTTLAALALIAGKPLAGLVSAGALALSRRMTPIMALSRFQWIALPLMLGLGVAGGVAGTKLITPKAPAAPVAEKPPEAVPPVGADPAVPDLPRPRSPFDVAPDAAWPAGPEMPEPEPKVEPPLVVRNGRVDLDPPPGYFDLPAPVKKDGVELPAAIIPGQMIQVEVLEALPGRPISGERVVKPDGTISLGFYGDLQVAGLNRYQAKVKLIEHLREHIIDEVLGLARLDMATGTWKAIPPAESNRVFIDEQIDRIGVERKNPAPDGIAALERGSLPMRMLKLEAELMAVRRESAELKASLDAMMELVRARLDAPTPATPKEAANPR